MIVALALVTLMMAQDGPPADLPAGAGPRGTSQNFGAARYDAVGYASWYGEEMSGTTASGQPFNPAAITAAHRNLPFGSVVEVTALDTGRTILVLINDRGPRVAGRIIDLSRGAAELLGVKQRSVAAVRVRLAEATDADRVALQAGRVASARLDASPQLTAALRKRIADGGASRSPIPAGAVGPAPARAPLPRSARVSPPPPRPATPESAPAPEPLADGIYVQLAAFSSRERAQALAVKTGGRVESIGTIHRVRLGPFSSSADAQAARDKLTRQGYADARIVIN